MQFKINTSEKFTVIMPIEENLSDNLTAELTQTAISYLQTDIKNIVLNLKNVSTVNDAGAIQLAKLQQMFYESNASFVICEIKPVIEEKLNELELLEVMNITPTESEAWDIVQMEEIERELLDDSDPLFNDHHESE